MAGRVPADVERVQKMGSAGDSPAPVGDSPTGKSASLAVRTASSQAGAAPALQSGGSPDGNADAWQGIRAGRLRWRVRARFSVQELTSVLADPDAWLDEPERVLKTSTTTTIARVVMQTAPEAGYILRAFRMSGWGARLRSLFRASRAGRVCRLGLALEQAGIAVAAPVAFAERRVAGFLYQSYLITQEIPAAQTLEEFWETTPEAGMRRRALRCLADLLAQLRNAGFGHSDLSLANVLVRAQADTLALFLVDLEGIYPVAYDRAVDAWARHLRRLNRRVKGASLTRLRFLVAFCRRCQPPLPPRELATAIQVGEREWHVRRLGHRPWLVRLPQLTLQARRIMAEPEACLAKHEVQEANANRASVFIPAEIPGQPAYMLQRVRCVSWAERLRWAWPRPMSPVHPALQPEAVVGGAAGCRFGLPGCYYILEEAPANRSPALSPGH